MNLPRLSEHELRVAGYVGVDRRVDRLFRLRDRVQRDDTPDYWGIDIDAAASELGIAHVARQQWNGVELYAPADVGELIQVRHTWTANGRLRVNPRDPDGHLYVLVVGRDNTFQAVGCILGRDAKRAHYLDDPNGWGRPVYMVPAADLWPIPW